MRHFDIRVPIKNYDKAGDINLQSVDSFECPYDEAFCPMVTLERYIKVTRELRMSPRLVLYQRNLIEGSLGQPTISHWVKNVVLTSLDRYIKVTKELRMSPRLFLISIKPHARASRATISRWIKSVMEISGIDIGVYKPHSTRSASVSKAASLAFPTDVILSRAGWKSSNCFAK